MVTNRSFHFGPIASMIASKCSARRRLRFLAHLLRELHPWVSGDVGLESDVVEQELERDQVLAERSRLARGRRGEAIHSAISVAVIVDGSPSPNVSPIFFSPAVFSRDVYGHVGGDRPHAD